MFAFSTFVMRALGRLPASQGVAAMQAINLAAPSPMFMVALMGTAAVCVVLAVWALVSWRETGSVSVLAASILYLVTIAMTAGFHIPRNDALAVLDPNAAATADHWPTYLRSWTLGNHFRTVTAITSALLFTIGSRAG